MPRADYAFPFRIDARSNEGARVSYATHVDQMVRQVLLTAPGERADLPEFGCGLRNLLFAPNTLLGGGQASPTPDAVQVTTQVMVQSALSRWLGDQIKVQRCSVTPGPDGDMSQILVSVSYVLLETQTLQQTQVTVT
jgi:phage baseplate assembly protein W